MTLRPWIISLAVTGLVVAGCGGGTTTVIQEPSSTESQVQTVTEQTTTVTQHAPPKKAPKPTSAPEPDTESSPSEAPPDVVGLTLPTAKKLLAQAGYKAEVSNTDATFGILVPENYTICTQDDPRGNLVPILAQKDGC